MPRTAIKLISVLVLGAALAGCAKCGGWERFNLPYGSAVCDDAKTLK